MKRCIFCKKNSTSSVSEEHILPLSLGNLSHVLAPGVVCDSCNNYFSRKVEKLVLESGYFTTLRTHQALPSRKGRVPALTGLLENGIPVRVNRDEAGKTTIDVPTEHWDAVVALKSIRIILPTTGPEPECSIMSRFIAKVAVEAMAFQILAAGLALENLIDDPQLDPIRNWARYGGTGKTWNFHRRVIYDANHKHKNADNETFQCLHEFDFLMTSRSEMYFCLAVFGMEYVINLGGPSLEGYLEWLNENDQRSPLYSQKNAAAFERARPTRN